jgi:hypothetical protein
VEKITFVNLFGVSVIAFFVPFILGFLNRHLKRRGSVARSGQSRGGDPSWHFATVHEDCEAGRVALIRVAEGEGMRSTAMAVLGSFALLGGVAAVRAVAADAPPRSFVASPDVYKVVGENEQYRVIEATWKPGQRDKLHSHGATVAAYLLTDCQMRNYLPDGTTKDTDRKAGVSSIRATDLNHSVENIGKTVCKMIIFEPK